MKKLISIMLITAVATTWVSAKSYPATGPKSYKALHDDDKSYFSGFYFGLAYSNMSTNIDNVYAYGNNQSFDVGGNSATVLIGVDLYKYFTLEARYTKSVDDLSLSVEKSGYDFGNDISGDIVNYAVYFKPKISSDSVTLYGLLGYGRSEIELDYVSSDYAESAFQWGFGISFDAGMDALGAASVTLFADYTRFAEDEYLNTDIDVEAFNFGLNYKF